MTGFGAAEAGGDAFTISVEVRSVNHRHLDVALRVSRVLSGLETEVRKLVQSRLERGRIDVAVQFGPATDRAAQQVRVDSTLAHDYLERARALADELGLASGVPLDWILERPGVLRLDEPEPPDPGALWPVLAEALNRALDALTAQRVVEGEALAGALRALASDLQSSLDQVAARAPAAAGRREERLRERLRALLREVVIDETRVLAEAAIWADRTDIAEELARLGAHLDQLRSMLAKGGPVGRPLDFLIQELNREVNTIGSKADDLDVSQSVIAAKSILEKMREQIQNLE